MDSFSPFNNLQSPVWIFDIDNKNILWANNKSLPLWEAESLEDLLSRDLGQDMSAAVEAVLIEYKELFKRNEAIKTWWRINPKKIVKNLLCQFSGLTLEDGRIVMLVEVIADESSLRRDLAFSHCSNLALLFNENGQLISANNAFTDSFGSHISDLSAFLGDNQLAAQWLNEKSIKPAFKSTQLCWTGKSHLWFDIDAKWLTDNSQLLLSLVNINNEKKKLQQEKYNAEHDYLTGLMNRRGILNALTNSHHHSHPYYLLFIDLDNFKFVNDTYGHTIGDKILREVSIRLLNQIKGRGLVARFGGDEFIIQIEQRNLSDLDLFTQQVIASLSRPCHINNTGDITISCTIGTANYPDDAKNFETLITQADMAMHHAKKRGRNCSYSYLPQMAEALHRKMVLRQHLSQALENESFELYYQPIIDLSTQRLKSVEALIRWHDDTLGHVSPSEFIPLAEETGQIVPLGQWLFKTACKQLAEWMHKYDRKFIVGINLSQIQLQPNLACSIEALLKTYDIDPSQLVLELTESAMLQEYNESKFYLDALAKLGIELYLDDFGTGYSSLSQLHDLPISTVKLDQSFVQGEQKGSKAIIEATKAICEKLGLKTVAEGVETEAQLAYIKECGFDFCQGFYFAKPMSVKEIETQFFEQKDKMYPFF